jgi:hypothetical protein
MIDIVRDQGQISAIRIDGHDLSSDDGERWTVPRGLLKDLPISALPEDAVFNVCEHVEDDIVYIDEVPLALRRIGQLEVEATIEELGRRKYWDGEVGYSTYMEAKLALIKDREREIGDLELSTTTTTVTTYRSPTRPA